ncbi:hypothetical protein MKZ38_005946 [Zalerion maritima]|uniref:Uncharacterized protein n=1 Tax=Zalerion maritima TaxID=339359 RepID=A0AAD5RVS3_9PEZI|nr:hypothetical protein MKZ38_005946 [Zalerion maritima]
MSPVSFYSIQLPYHLALDPDSEEVMAAVLQMYSLRAATGPGAPGKKVNWTDEQGQGAQRPIQVDYSQHWPMGGREQILAQPPRDTRRSRLTSAS